MPRASSDHRGTGDPLESRLEATAAELEAGVEAEGDEAAEPSFFEDPRRIVQTAIFVLVCLVGIYFLFPKLIEDEDAIAKLGRADPVWLGIAFGFSVAMFFSYVALFRGVVGERIDLRWRESYEITLAGLAATRLFSAGGAGGIALTYWALRKAGMPPRQTACRMVAFLVLVYAVYMATLLIDGVLLRTGVFAGPSPAGLTIVPAAIAGAVVVIFLLIALIPEDLERRMARFTQGYRSRRLLRRLASAPATVASGTRTAIAFVREPSRGGLAVLGALGFWATQIGILWAAFKAVDIEVPLAVVVQGFFVGMLANLIPLPGGVGGVDAGMLGAFALFDVGGPIFTAILIYRVIAFWLPIPPGAVAFFQLRKTVRRWEDEGRGSVGGGLGRCRVAAGTPYFRK
ncbi:MAG: lysylphosphatidylglycerol synthase transmembrane domain-containing protein [Solirubrobacterales bacterium]